MFLLLQHLLNLICEQKFFFIFSNKVCFYILIISATIEIINPFTPRVFQSSCFFQLFFFCIFSPAWHLNPSQEGLRIAPTRRKNRVYACVCVITVYIQCTVVNDKTQGHADCVCVCVLVFRILGKKNPKFWKMFAIWILS